MVGRLGILIPVLFLAGCLTPQLASRSMMDRLRAVGGPQGPDVVVFDVAEIEQPPSDGYIDRDLWAALDETAIGHGVARDGGPSQEKADPDTREPRPHPSPMPPGRRLGPRVYC